MLRQPHRGNKVAPSGTYNDGWSEADNAELQKLIEPLKQDPPKIDPLGCFGSEARGLACASRDIVYDRTMSFLSTLNVMSGLVLAAIAPLALYPLDTKTLPAGPKRQMGDVFNVMAYAAVTTQICVVMFSTYCLLMVAAHAHTPAMLYRALPHSGFLFGAFQVGNYQPLLLWLTKTVLGCVERRVDGVGRLALIPTQVLGAHIHMATAWAKWACTATVIAIYLFFHVTFGLSSSRAWPRGYWGWAGLTLPYLFFNDRFRRDVVANSSLYFSAAEQGVLAGKDEDHDGSVDRGPREVSPAERELATFVAAALPDLVDPRRGLVVRAMAIEGLTVPRIRAAAKHSGGYAALLQTLELGSRGVELTRGERLALATAAIS